MVRGFAMLADELVQLGIGLEIDAGADFPPAIGVQRLLLDDLAGDADAGAEFPSVLHFRHIVEQDARRFARVPGFGTDAAPAG
jgi:hypothetical protein